MNDILGTFNNIKVVTGECILKHGRLFKPESFKGGAEKYSVVTIINKDDAKTLDKINNAVETVAKQQGYDINHSNIKLPLRDGDVEKPNDPLYANAYFLTAYSLIKPSVVDGNMVPNYGEDDVVDGQYGRVSFNVYFFDYKGSKGIACRLLNVQTSKKIFCPPSTAEDDFGVVSNDNENITA